MARQAPAATPQILETAGCIGSRLTLPKLHLATYNMFVNNSPSQVSNYPDDHFQSRYVTRGFKPFSFRPFQLLKPHSLNENAMKTMEDSTVNFQPFQVLEENFS